MYMIVYVCDLFIYIIEVLFKGYSYGMITELDGHKKVL